jgi:hypothetical protein
MKKIVPTIHQQMIYIGCVIMMTSMILYFFAPTGKSEAFIAVMTTSMGFLFGKFTNGFAGKPKPVEGEQEE